MTKQHDQPYAVGDTPTGAPPATVDAPARFVHGGDRSRAICPQCHAMRDTEYQERSVYLKQTKVTVPNVMVGVCTVCDAIITLPAQSIPLIKAARAHTSGHDGHV